MRHAAMAAAAVAALAISACSSAASSGAGGGSGTPSSGGGGASNASATTFNEGLTKVVNPSHGKGGVATYDITSGPDSFDGGNTYYAWVLNLSRLWAQPLFTYKSCPGKCGDTLVPDLATSMGTVSGNGLTWTFHIKSGVKFSDGSPVTSRDVKYGIERTYDRSQMQNGPNYYPVLLTDPKYPGPYKNRSKNLMGLTAVQTPDPTTLVIHLQSPFPDLPYVLAFPSTAPVRPSKDTGSSYQTHMLSTGPYEFQSYQVGKQAVLVPNPDWNAKLDPQAQQNASKIILNLSVNQADIDNRLLANDIQVDLAGVGVGPAAQAKILTTASLKARADDPYNGFAFFAYLDTKVAPLNNVHCRRAVEYAVNKTTAQTAYGGPYAGGAIASTIMPPNIQGYQKFDLYEATTKPTGDLVKAKAELAKCGHPSGFTTTLAYRSDRPKETAAATAIQAALKRVGIIANPQGFLASKYYTNFAGAPAYDSQHDVGIAMGGWGADWPDGYGFLDELLNGNAIVSSGNTNISNLNDPAINKLFTDATHMSSSAALAVWPKIDKMAMQQAAIVPLIYAKALLYRPPSATNVYVQEYYGMYNYAVMGAQG